MDHGLLRRDVQAQATQMMREEKATFLPDANAINPSGRVRSVLFIAASPSIDSTSACPPASLHHEPPATSPAGKATDAGQPHKHAPEGGFLSFEVSSLSLRRITAKPGFNFRWNMCEIPFT